MRRVVAGWVLRSSMPWAIGVEEGGLVVARGGLGEGIAEGRRGRG